VSVPNRTARSRPVISLFRFELNLDDASLRTYWCETHWRRYEPIGETSMWHELQPDDPQQIGPYRLRGQLGVGGMGRVFLGFSAGGRPVAIKVVRPDLAADPEFRARFRREVAVARRVSGQYTAPLIDADLVSPMPWLATAYVPGP
jgi:serine/threonine protein kinase